MATKFSTIEVQKLQAQIKEVDDKRVDGKFVSVSGEVLAGNDETCELLRKCQLWSNIVLERYVFVIQQITKAPTNYRAGRARCQKHSRINIKP